MLLMNLLTSRSLNFPSGLTPRPVTRMRSGFCSTTTSGSRRLGLNAIRLVPSSLLVLSIPGGPVCRSGFAGRSRTAHTKIELLRLLALLTVLGTRLLAVRHALTVVDAANDVVAHAGQIFYAAAADEHNRMFLKIVAFAGNVDRDFLAVAQS